MNVVSSAEHRVAILCNRFLVFGYVGQLSVLGADYQFTAPTLVSGYKMSPAFDFDGD